MGNLDHFGFIGVLEAPVSAANNKVPEIVYAIYEQMFAVSLFLTVHNVTNPYLCLWLSAVSSAGYCYRCCLRKGKDRTRHHLHFLLVYPRLLPSGLLDLESYRLGVQVGCS